jgi:hypothetical protein
MMRASNGARLWAIGSYWLLALVCSGCTIVLLTGKIAPWIVLSSIVGIEIILLCIDALSLRSA